MRNKIEEVLILDYQYYQKKNFLKKKLIFINKQAYNLNKKVFIFNKFKIIKNEDFNRAQRKKNYKYLNNLHNKFVDLLTIKLNKINKCDLKKKQWNILIGSWLFYYLSTCFNRNLKLERFFKTNKNVTVYLEKSNNKIKTFSTNDFLKSVHLNDSWNAEVYHELLKLMRKKIKIYNYKKKDLKENTLLEYKVSLKRKIISKVLNFFFLKFSKNNSFIIQSYLSIFEEIYLNFKINGVPLFFVPRKIKIKSTDGNYERKLNCYLTNNKKDNFFNFLNKKILSDVPYVFTKYFSKLSKEVNNSKWPKNIKTIFTSNLYETDEFFKMFTALQKKNNSNYIIGQHGNSYNVTIQNEYNPELSFSDKFLSWSSIKLKKNFIPFGNFTSESRNIKKKKFFKVKKILLVLRSSGLNYEVFDRPGMNREYKLFLLLFLKNLSSQTVSKLIIKPHFSQINDKFLSIIKKRFENIEILKVNVPLDKYFRDDSTLVIFNYDSSGLYKTFHLNKPTICFWPNGLNHLRDSSIDYYKRMEKNRIFYRDPKKLSLRLENLIHNQKISKWWFSKSNQNFIDRFNYRYNVKVGKSEKLLNLVKVLSNKILE
jgi:putative transferase (TIGR04331 family)